MNFSLEQFIVGAPTTYIQPIFILDIQKMHYFL